MSSRQDRQSIRAQLEANYHQVASELLRQQLATLHVIYGLFGGDIEAFYILGVIAQRTAEHQEFKASPWAERQEGEPLPSLTTNVRSVAESTGIPEETVRRKVAGLVARGWVRKEGRCLSYTAQGSQELAPLRDALLDLAAAHYRIVAAKL
jgi:hypothetical protein